MRQMLSVSGVVERYKNIVSNVDNINWAIKKCYKINNNESFNLNNNSNGLKIKDGRVECYVIDDEEIPLNAIFYDFETKKEYKNVFDPKTISYENFIEKYSIKSGYGSIKWYDQSLNHFYPHPWYPDEEIIGFQVIRILPGFNLNETYYLSSNPIVGEFLGDSRYIYSYEEKKPFIYSETQCLNFPEFFNPIYEKEHITRIVK